MSNLPEQLQPPIEEKINRRFTIAKLIIIESIGLLGFLLLAFEGLRRELHF